MSAGALLPWGIGVFALGWAYPWARWLFPHDRIARLVLTPGLSAGGLAGVMLALAALGPDWVGFWPVTGLVGGLALAGGWMARRAGARPSQPDTASDADPGHPLTRTTALTVLVLVALVLFNAAYWPLGEDDALSLYAPMAYRFATSGAFGGSGAYDAYPQLGPLIMAYVQLGNGAVHEYVWRFMLAVLAMVTVGAAYLLGRDMFSRRVGLAAAYLTAATPIALHWAAAAYTDLPAGGYYGLAVWAAWRLARQPARRTALLAGLLAGCAAFTKNGALLLPPALAGWVVYTWWAARQRTEPPVHAIGLRDGLLLAGGFLLLAGPWYGHTLHVQGVIVPPTGWIDQARHTLKVLVGPALVFHQYMLTGALAVLGILWQAVRLWRARPGFDPRAALLLGCSVPFWGVWWWLFSYDIRFLLMIWSLAAVMGADVLLALGDGVMRAVRLPRWVTRRALPLVVVVLALPAMRMGVDYKPALLRQPWMDDTARHVQQIGPRWLTVDWLKRHTPAGARVLVADTKLAFNVLAAGFEVTFSVLTEPALVHQYDYWIASPGQQPDWLADSGLEAVYAVDGYRVYALGEFANRQ
ncbi:MAG: hypothetical protein Kow0077_19290 [Anaerolineae bacterium]